MIIDSGHECQPPYVCGGDGIEAQEPCHDRWMDDMDNVCEMPREYNFIRKLC